MTDSIRFKLDGLPSRAAMADEERGLADALGKDHQLVAAVGWSQVCDCATTILHEHLDGQEGLAWLARAWTIADALKAAARETLDGRSSKRVSLLAHDIAQQVLPTVTLRCGTFHLDLPFDLTLTAAVDVIDLVVKRGRLVALAAGRLTPSATLSLAGVRIAGKACGPIELNPSYTLPGNGLAIAGASLVGEVGGSP
jgi:hypothetical protein